MHWHPELIATLKSKCAIELSNGTSCEDALGRLLDAVFSRALQKAGNKSYLLADYVEFPWDPGSVNLDLRAMGIKHITLRFGCREQMDFLTEYAEQNAEQICEQLN